MGGRRGKVGGRRGKEKEKQQQQQQLCKRWWSRVPSQFGPPDWAAEQEQWRKEGAPMCGACGEFGHWTRPGHLQHPRGRSPNVLHLKERSPNVLCLKGRSPNIRSPSGDPQGKSAR
ncbi:UNVERIFIED_CONTAM: hypothetical protein FKN15_017256 [Acipenser sinensis]